YEIEPDLATGYELSADNLVYTIHLREGVQWHDEQPFTADDVVFTIRSIQTPEYGSPLESSFQGVLVEKIDDHTVRFSLKQSYAPFLTNLTVGIVPKHVWEQIPPGNASLAEQMLKPIGTGPFKFAELTTRRRTGEVTAFQAIRNEAYYGQKPYLDEIIFTFFPTHEEASRAFVTGKTDGLGFLQLSQAQDVKSRSSLSLHRLLLPQYFGLFFNEIRNEALGDAGVRSALALATDRRQVIEQALEGEAREAVGPIPEALFDFGEELTKSTFDPETAKQNLEDAGWRDANSDGVREKDGKELRVTITTTDWPEYVKTAEVVKDQWQAIGVGVEVESFGAGVIQQTIVGPREYEVLLYGEILSIDPDPYPFWHSTQTRSPGLNLSLFKDERTDKILEDARRTHQLDQRQELYKEFHQRFMELHPAVILYQPYYLFATRGGVRGNTMEKTNLPASRFNDIENWHVNTKRVWNTD
ncbi:MAG: ABC transporter substrate-binding protein, partial [Acidobacteriota bacterium]